MQCYIPADSCCLEIASWSINLQFKQTRKLAENDPKIRIQVDTPDMKLCDALLSPANCCCLARTPVQKWDVGEVQSLQNLTGLKKSHEELACIQQCIQHQPCVSMSMYEKKTFLPWLFFLKILPVMVLDKSSNTKDCNLLPLAIRALNPSSVTLLDDCNLHLVNFSPAVPATSFKSLSPTPSPEKLASVYPAKSFSTVKKTAALTPHQNRDKSKALANNKELHMCR